MGNCRKRNCRLLSCVGKLFTALLNDRMTKYIDAVEDWVMNRLVLERGHSRVDHIFVLHSILNMYLHKGKRI